jgi:hypothetical protein
MKYKSMSHLGALLHITNLAILAHSVRVFYTFFAMQSSVFSTCLFLPTPAKDKISVVAGGYWVLLMATIH